MKFSKLKTISAITIIFSVNSISLAGQYTWTPTSGSGNITSTTYRTGGVSIGTSIAPPTNGLLVKKNLAINVTPVADPAYRLEVGDNTGSCIYAHSDNASYGHGVIWAQARNTGNWDEAAIEGQGFGACVGGRFYGESGKALDVCGSVYVMGSSMFLLSPAASVNFILEKKGDIDNNYPMLKSSYTGPYGTKYVDLRAAKCSSNVAYNCGIGGEFYGGYMGLKAIVAPGGAWAGYFEGNVYTTGSYLPSDEKLKTNMTSYDNAVDKLCKLKPVSYNYDVAHYPEMNLPKQKQNGLIAQEVETVFPELVAEIIPKEKVQTLKTQGEKAESYKCINYTALVPVLVKAIQEQQIQIKELQKKIQQLEGY